MLAALASPTRAGTGTDAALSLPGVDPARLLASGTRLDPTPILQPSKLQHPDSGDQPVRFSAEASDDFARRVPGCGMVAVSSQEPRAVTTCPFTDLATGLNLSTTIGGFETHARFARGFINPWTAQNQVTALPGGAGYQNTAALLGFSTKLLNGRITLRSDQAWSSTWQSPYFAEPFELRRHDRLSGRASWLGLDATLLRSGSLAWSVGIDYSSVGDRFLSGQSPALRTVMALPGERLALSSKLRIGSNRLSLSNDRYRGSFGRSTASRVALSRDGLSLSLGTRTFDSQVVPGLAAYASHSRLLSGSFDLFVDEASSGVLARLGRSPLFPRTLSLSWRSGGIDNSLPGGIDHFRRRSWSLSAGWETRFGETQLDYSQDRRIGITAALGSRSDTSLQLSHMVRWNGWRAGVDGTVTRSQSSRQSGYRSTSYSTGATLAYQVTNGPEFMFQLGRDRDRTLLNDRSYQSANDGTRLTASLDLTAFINHRFARHDMRLRLDVRTLIEARQDDLFDPEQQLFEQLYDRRARDVVQLSFGMAF